MQEDELFDTVVRLIVRLIESSNEMPDIVLSELLETLYKRDVVTPMTYAWVIVDMLQYCSDLEDGLEEAIECVIDDLDETGRKNFWALYQALKRNEEAVKPKG